ncbi:MAG: hypothetical protein JW733_06015 [Coriobacteriia bacterium]|nr:hypothetical protein [Coriobacteriia bacterium]MBN2839558.1 hypothetical protein [Coriobacteriia bacterium]
MMKMARVAASLAFALLLGLAIAGCTTEPGGDAVPLAGGEGVTDEAAPSGAGAPGGADVDGVPPADPSLGLEDGYGRTPADAFLEHMAAVATGDPEEVWETYGCSPPSDFDTWAFEWEDAAEVYSGAQVLEERVVGPGLALVRVVYRVTSGDDEMIVDEPGEWWRIEQVEGEWKVGWLPRQ